MSISSFTELSTRETTCFWDCKATFTLSLLVLVRNQSLKVIQAMGRGKLVFKGEEKTRKKKKKKTKHDKPAAPPGDSITSTTAATTTPSTALSASDQVIPSSGTPTQPTVQKGTGQITTSGTVVTGHDTRFQRELAVGDAIIVANNNGEMRVITMCLTDASLNISSAFSQDVSRPADFEFIRKPRKKAAAETNDQVKAKEPASTSGLYGSSKKNELVYREKTEHGSYRIKRLQVDGGKELSRGDLLNMRSKKKSDKYC